MRIVILILILLANLYSDMLKAEAGAGVWLSSSEGEVVRKGDLFNFEDELGLDSSTSVYAWANFKHFIPVIPNARLEITKFGSEADSYIRKVKVFDEMNVSGKTNSKLDLDQIDAILYYNLWDTFLFVDVGFGVKYYSGSIEIGGKDVNIDFPLAILYGRVGADVPLTPFQVESDLKYFKYSDNIEMYDLRLKIQGTAIDLGLLELNLEFGYRVHRLYILTSSSEFFLFGDSFDTDIKTEFSGFFGGVNIAF